MWCNETINKTNTPATSETPQPSDIGTEAQELSGGESGVPTIGAS